MLDTIILQIPNDMFIISNKEAFSIPYDELVASRKSYLKSYFNPTAKDKMLSIYKPRLTLFKRGRLIFLKIEFSAPKLLFHNNVDELSENDFSEVLNTLQQRLKEMGIHILSEVLKNTDVLSFHPSKNIILSHGYTASYVINELSKVNVSKALDLDIKDFRNCGQALQFYSNSHSFVIYDKVADLAKPKGRAIDKDQTNSQLTIFDAIKQQKTPKEILRLEVRLSKKRKMNSILEKVGYPPNPKFKDIFKKSLNQKIVSHYWDHLFTKNLFLFSTPTGPQQIFQHMLSENPEMKITEAIRNMGLIFLCRDQDGIRGLRTTIEQNKPKTNWQVVNKYLKSLNQQNFTPNQFIQDIEEQTNRFSIFRIKKDRPEKIAT